MDRTGETRAKFINLTKTQESLIFALYRENDIELVNGTVGIAAWSRNRKAEDEFLKLAKLGKAEIKSRFPKRFDKNGNKVTKENLKDHNVKDLLDASEVAPILKEKQMAEYIAKLEKELNAMTKADLNKKYGVSSDQTKALMIKEIIDKLKLEGEI